MKLSLNLIRSLDPTTSLKEILGLEELAKQHHEDKISQIQDIGHCMGQMIQFSQQTNAMKKKNEGRETVRIKQI